MKRKKANKGNQSSSSCSPNRKSWDTRIEICKSMINIYNIMKNYAMSGRCIHQTSIKMKQWLAWSGALTPKETTGVAIAGTHKKKRKLNAKARNLNFFLSFLSFLLFKCGWRFAIKSQIVFLSLISSIVSSSHHVCLQIERTHSFFPMRNQLFPLLRSTSASTSDRRDMVEPWRLLFTIESSHFSRSYTFRIPAQAMAKSSFIPLQHSHGKRCKDGRDETTDTERVIVHENSQFGILIDFFLLFMS